MKLQAAAVVLALLAAAPAFAQTAETTPPPAGEHRGAGGPGFGREGMHDAPAPITNSPFSAKYASTANFTTREGKAVELNSSEAVYRDSLGRTREDITLPPRPDSTGTESSTAATTTPRTESIIFDPVANTVTRLMASRKVAVVETVPAAFFTRAAAREAREAAGAVRPNSNAVVTDLAAKTVAGVSATGKRIVRTLPAHGDDTTPVTLTTETYFSPDLKIEVSSSETGGRGTRSNILTALTKAEPDATLFKVPEGYTTKTAQPHDHHGYRGSDDPSTPPPAF